MDDIEVRNMITFSGNENDINFSKLTNDCLIITINTKQGDILRVLNNQERLFLLSWLNKDF